MDGIKHQPSGMAKLMKIIKGFTLVELLVVIAIIGILASLAITSFQFILVRAQDSRNKALAGTVGSAISQYGVDHGNNYPISNGEVDILTLGEDLGNYLKTTNALTQATGVAKYMSSADGSSFAAIWELKYTNEPTVTTGNGVYSTDAANLAGAVSIPGVLGDAINFGGGQTETQLSVKPSSTVSIPHNAAMNFDSNFTASFWFKAELWNNIPVLAFLAYKFSSSNPQLPFVFRLENAQVAHPSKWNPAFYRRNISGVSVTVLNPTEIEDGDGWHHFVGIKNGGTLSLIIDNGIPSTKPDVPSTSDNTADIKVGPIGPTGDALYSGDIDDFRIYNTALTTGAGSQVEALFNAGKGSAVNPLLNNTVGHWRFDEGSGSILKDSGPAAIDGTLSNILSGTWTKGIVPRFGFTGIGSSLLGKAFVVYGPQ
ncbi:MAG: LamG-like jellyroll fold domain-containing protein [bacterium]|nr:LamG-like jellyroll fold domain-containing protein [bacterium]